MTIEPAMQRGRTMRGQSLVETLVFAMALLPLL